MSDLSDAFAEQKTNAIDWNGTTVHGLVELDDLPSRITLTFVSAKQYPVQGIQLRLKGGSLVANGHESSDIVLWHDSAPERSSVEVRPGGGGKQQLKIWNVWRGGRDTTQAWLGNAAIQLEGDPASGSFRMRCSDGQGEPTFDDLVVDVELS